MSAILDVDLSTFCGRIGRIYGQHRLCPPFALHQAAESWITKGIPLSHCVNVIERYLSRHAASCYSGSGDWNFAWLSTLIQTNWHERYVSPPGAQSKRPNVQRVADPLWRSRQTKASHDVDPERSSISREAPGDGGSDIPAFGRHDQAAPRGVRSTDQNQKQPTRIDQAIAFLRRELADGEVAVTRLEQKAKASGISTRTLDQARVKLKVISRRTGFAKKGKSWLSLPTAP